MKTFKQFILENKEWPSGHWYNHETKKLHDVSEDGGPGDHMGFLWSSDGNNHKKLGVEKHHADALKDMYESGEPTEKSHNATMAVLSKNTRLIHTDKHIGVMTHNSSRENFKHAQHAVHAIMSQKKFHPDVKVNWETKEDDHNFKAMEPGEFMEKKRIAMEKHKIY